MSKSNKFVFVFLQIIAWIIFIGLTIEAGALIVNFFFSIYNPEVVRNLYQKLDLSLIRESSNLAFYGLYISIIAISVLKAVLFYVVILILLKLDLLKPFNTYVAVRIKRISYLAFSAGIISYIVREATNKHFDIEALDQFWADGKAYILMAAVIYIIAAIFSRGVEIQNENDLTV